MSKLNNIQKIIAIAILIIILGIIGYYIYGREDNNVDMLKDEEILVKSEENVQSTSDNKIVVHIIGAVKKEGVVTLNENSRVTDAVDAAGGFTEDADLSKVNLAHKLEDGVKIKIPSKNDAQEEQELTNSENFVDNFPENYDESKNSIVNINKATQTELETLPGIGPSLALKIINYREENGKFSNIEDLKNVNGIGDNKYENLKEYISVK